MSRTIDFRKQWWGHALHADTWTPLPPRIEGRLWRRRAVERVSVLVHCTPTPRAGDEVLFNAKSGERRARIAEVDFLNSNPEDMYGLVLEEA